MKLLVIALVVATALALYPGEAQAAYYRVTLTRRGKDLYQDLSSRALVLTRFCHEHVHGDSAVLSYEPNSYENMVHFSSGTTCDVRGVYRVNAVLTRVGDNVYRDEFNGGYLRTQFCFEYAYSSEALVLSDRVMFLAGETCDLAW